MHLPIPVPAIEAGSVALRARWSVGTPVGLLVRIQKFRIGGAGASLP